MNRFRFLSLRLLFPAGPPKRRARPASPSIRKIGGFTLLEVMTVVGVIAIMSSIAIYSINTNLDRIRADTAGRRISIALNYARIRAISENTNYVVQFLSRANPGKNESMSYIRMFADVNKNGTYDSGEASRIEDLPMGIIFDLNGPKDIDNTVVTSSSDRDGIVFTDNKLTFYPRGSTFEKGELYIIPYKNIEDGTDKNRRAVSVERLSGKTIVWVYDIKRLDKGLCAWRLEGE
ncbi:MAG: GspH/FimT family pseudopilin [Deltaproteobacteria bacterium]|nr:GspH/FimT family pseudopilin [Candidatus Zymogenaceae bacterium]